MKIEYKNNWPMDSTRFLLPTIAFRGFRKGTRIVTLAVWTWRINFILPNAEDYREVSVTNGVDSSDWMDSKMEENTNG
jgi:hypothetical protein